MRVLLIILDGLGDRPAPELGGKTPLEAANTPNLDRLAAQGVTGLMDPIAPGIAPGSDTAHFVIFGYSLSDFPGRGVFETVGEGLELNDGDVVCRASFAWVKEQDGCLQVVDRCIGVEEECCQALAREISEKEFGGIRFHFVYNGKRQGILFLKGEASPNITDSDPFCDDMPVIKIQPLEGVQDKRKTKHTADCLNEYLKWAYRKLVNHPVNASREKAGLPLVSFLLTKWAGRRRPLIPFDEKYGFRAATIASGPLFRGLAAEIGLTFFEVKQIKDAEEDLRNRFKMAERAFKEGYDFVHIHTKTIDDAAHTKDPTFKKRVIEDVDKSFNYLLSSQNLIQNSLIIVTSDHSTPSRGELIHSGEPVPIAIVGENVRKDGVERFSESACTQGLGRIRGSDLMNIILDLTDRIKYYGTRPTARDIPHQPRKVIPLRLFSEGSL
ncbi:MAG: alkaline phosphatase family protein [Actinomycetota bacterium]|nr:alkaline phosphatase family protein [Actinomycetota bacterium]